MFATPSISIITVVYNGAHLIEKTIKSVLFQTYSNIEYIIIDGGSKDGTLEIIKKYSNQISNVVSEKDSGIFDGMNKGLLLAQSDYVLFLNAGDALSSTSILSQILTESGNCDVYYGMAALVNENDTMLKLPRIPRRLSWRTMTKGWGAIPICHQAFIAKRALCPTYDLQYRYTSDFDWMIKVLKNSSTISNKNITIANYLLGGYTSVNLRKTWHDRFLIVKNNYGITHFLLLHIKYWMVFIKYSLQRNAK